MKRHFETRAKTFTNSNDFTKNSTVDGSDAPPKKKQKILVSNQAKPAAITTTTTAATSSNKRHYQTTPIVYIHNENNEQEHHSNQNDWQRPLLFGEPILDGLGVYDQHETMVQLEQYSNMNHINHNENDDNQLDCKTSNNFVKIVISANENNDNNSNNNSSSSTKKSFHDESNINKDCDYLAFTCILGHSVYSPTRALKETLLSAMCDEDEDDEWVDSCKDKEKGDGDRIKSRKRSRHSSFRNLLTADDSNYSIDKIGYPKVACVMILMDCNNNIFLTQRHSRLRSFPNCWVFPGGSIDPNETLLDAGIREVLEETGININKYKKSNNVKNMQMVAIWESIFPDVEYNLDKINKDNNTFGKQEKEKEKDKKKNEEKDEKHAAHKIVKYHHIVPFFLCQLKNVSFEELQKNNEIKVCETEVECYTWASVDQLKENIFVYDDITSKQAMVNAKEKLKAWNSKNEEIKSDACQLTWQSLMGIYPNDIGCGFGRGHRYALKKVVENFDIKPQE